MSAARKGRPGPAQHDALQRIVAAASVLLVLAIFSYLAWQAFIREAVPPRISVEITALDLTASPYRVSFNARNAGTRAAAAVQVEGTIVVDGGIVESAFATLDYLPGGAVRRGALLFRTPFRREQLRVRALGYADP